MVKLCACYTLLKSSQCSYWAYYDFGSQSNPISFFMSGIVTNAYTRYVVINN